MNQSLTTGGPKSAASHSNIHDLADPAGLEAGDHAILIERVNPATINLDDAIQTRAEIHDESKPAGASVTLYEVQSESPNNTQWDWSGITWRAAVRERPVVDYDLALSESDGRNPADRQGVDELLTYDEACKVKEYLEERGHKYVCLEPVDLPEDFTFSEWLDGSGENAIKLEHQWDWPHPFRVWGIPWPGYLVRRPLPRLIVRRIYQPMKTICPLTGRCFTARPPFACHLEGEPGRLVFPGFTARKNYVLGLQIDCPKELFHEVRARWKRPCFPSVQLEEEFPFNFSEEDEATDDDALVTN